MTRKFLSIMMLLFTISVMGAEEWPSASQLMPMPLNPKVKSGKLDNGLSYYILHNEEPKGKANFYIAQKVGSAQEEPDQLGLAHFLEHMAFNGIEHYPGKSMLEYLQLKGIRFGYDINAGTGYDQTVYNINNVPTADKNLMDSVLLVLYDWSGGILLEDAEIEAERGVIREEMRMSENAMQRMINNISPIIFPDYAYQHPIIGTEDVIMNFKPETIRAYYKKWYRPDLQGIVIVGDFDADEMEVKVKELFSKIEMPANAAERIYPSFKGNEEPVYAYYSDPEMQFPLAIVFFNEEPMPFEIRNTVQMYAMDHMLKTLISSLINQRLNEYTNDPGCSYASADVNFGNFLISKSAASFSIETIAKNEKDVNQALTDAMSIVARACATGFTDSEYDRIKEILLSNLENKYNERDKTNNNVLGRELCNHFIDNEPSPGIEAEYMLWKQMLPMLPVEAINEAARELLKTDNMVVVVAEPQKDGMTVTSKEVILNTINNAMTAEYEAYEDSSIDEPMISSLPQSGKVVNKEINESLGLTTYTLSNGVKVIVKPTDFSADEIIFSAFRKGGKVIYQPEVAPDVLVMDYVFMNAMFGPYNQVNLRKYLAGKKVNLSLNVGNTTDVISGSSTVKDLTTAMEMLYTAFTNLQPDKTTYEAFMDRIKGFIANLESTPDYIFGVRSEADIYDNNPFTQEASLKLLDSVNYDNSFALIQNLLKNAANYTFTFIGNVDEETLIPLLEQYVATLPAGKVTEPKVVTPINISKGQIKDEWTQKMQTPTVYIKNVYSGYNVPYTMKDYIMISMAGEIVQAIFLETLREDEGGTYSPSAMTSYNIPNKSWELEYQVLTAPEKMQTILDRADLELNNILTNGTDQNHFNKVKEAKIQQYQNHKRLNRYWDSELLIQTLHPEVNCLEEYENALNSITLDDLNNFLKNLYNGENRIQVIMEGVAE
ncbi:MAG: insulinase family protein [Muribaculaceae bacterium]|nr:insulinase family protein [Muribaculaceae bacterium]